MKVSLYKKILWSVYRRYEKIHFRKLLTPERKGLDYISSYSSRCLRMPITRNRKNGKRSWSTSYLIAHQGKMPEGQSMRSQTRLKQQQQQQHLSVGKCSLGPRKMTGWFIFNIRKTILKGETAMDKTQYNDCN